MGKRSKRNTANDDSKNIEIVMNKKIKFEDISKTEKTKFESEQTDTPKAIKRKSKKKQNTHKNNMAIGDEHENNIEIPESKIETVESFTSDKNVITEKKNKSRSKKNKLIESKESETINNSVPVDNQTEDHPNKLRKTKDTNLSQEDEVNDEDIDKFCDEISEEDNVQYENWVKLIEAQLSGNKKKPK